MTEEGAEKEARGGGGRQPGAGKLRANALCKAAAAAPRELYPPGSQPPRRVPPRDLPQSVPRQARRARVPRLRTSNLKVARRSAGFTRESGGAGAGGGEDLPRVSRASSEATALTILPAAGGCCRPAREGSGWAGLRLRAGTGSPCRHLAPSATNHARLGAGRGVAAAAGVAAGRDAGGRRREGEREGEGRRVSDSRRHLQHLRPGARDRDSRAARPSEERAGRY